MLLAIDIGNSSTSVGVFDITDKSSPNLIADFKITSRDSSADEYTIILKDFLSRVIDEISLIKHSVISSVVPRLTDKFLRAAENISNNQPFVVASGIHTGFGIRIKNPEQLGTDIVSNISAAVNLYSSPLVVLDMGTATTITVVDENKTILGTIITPGVKISLDALYNSAAQLNDIVLDEKLELIGKDTRTSVSSGIINGNALMIDGFLRNIRDELNIKERGLKLNLVATGGLSELILPHLRNKFEFDKNLTLKGLAYLFSINRK